MWCSFCQQEVPGELSADSLSLRCTYCGSPENNIPEAVDDVTRTRPQLPRLGTIREEMATNSTVPSSNGTCYISRIDELRREARQHQVNDSPATVPPRMAGFFLVVFVFGQLMSNWALLNSHYAAWLAGLIFSLAGITIALCSLLSQVGVQQKIIQRLMPPPASRHEESRPAVGTLQPHLSYGRADGQKVSA